MDLEGTQRYRQFIAFLRTTLKWLTEANTGNKVIFHPYNYHQTPSNMEVNKLQTC